MREGVSSKAQRQILKATGKITRIKLPLPEVTPSLNALKYSHHFGQNSPHKQRKESDVQIRKLDQDCIPSKY